MTLAFAPSDCLAWLSSDSAIFRLLVARSIVDWLIAPVESSFFSQFDVPAQPIANLELAPLMI